VADAMTRSKAAADAKTVAMKAATDAEAKQKEAAAVQQTVAKAVTDATNKAKPANINLAAPSPTVTLKITAAPITMDTIQPSANVKRGASLELPVTIHRLYDYADAVQLKTKLPDGAKGIKVTDPTIAAGTSEGKLVIEVAADAAAGPISLNVQATSKFNGQDLSVAQDVPLVIE
jgi:hypothetical protein